jgi:hypothetical protein
MTKNEILFTIQYGIKTMEFACGDDNCYRATFVDESGETFKFSASRAKVMEHVERFAAHPEKYLMNKGLVVAHFHRMAMTWYAMAHLPKCVKQAMDEYNKPMIKVLVKGEKGG